MKKLFSIVLACLLVSILGAIQVFAAETAPTAQSGRLQSGLSQSGISTQLQSIDTSKISDSLTQAINSTRYSMANMILGDSDYVIVQSPSVSVQVAKKAHPDLNWAFDEMELENGRYVNEIQAVDANGVTQKVKVDALTSEIVSDTLASTGAAAPAAGQSVATTAVQAGK